jgi:hypothetical protein
MLLAAVRGASCLYCYRADTGQVGVMGGQCNGVVGKGGGRGGAGILGHDSSAHVWCLFVYIRPGRRPRPIDGSAQVEKQQVYVVEA